MYECFTIDNYYFKYTCLNITVLIINKLLLPQSLVTLELLFFFLEPEMQLLSMRRL